MPFQIVRDSIIHLKADAIVNAANTMLKMGGGVCGAIFHAAGTKKLQDACDKIGYCGVGQAVITPGFDLPAKYIIHTVGPVWQGGRSHEKELLTSCYEQSLALAKSERLDSIAFPLVSSGIFGYPKDRALEVAVAAIGAFLLKNDMTVYLVVYDKAAYQLSKERFHSIKSYIDEHYIEEKQTYSNRGREFPNAMCAPFDAMPMESSLRDAVSHLEDTFAQSVLHWIDKLGQKDSDVYKRANLDRKLFSKLRNDAHYQPSKATAIALSIALTLNLDQTQDLLGRAGYALSPASRSDMIVRYFIEQGNYNIFEINEALFEFDEALIGA